MNRVRGKWLIGGALAALLIFGCIGTFTAGAFMMGSRFNSPMMYGRQGPAQIAPGDDLPPQQAPRGYRDDRFYNNYGPGMMQPGRGWGFSPFGFIGGIFRLFFTLALLALAVLVLRRLFFGRGPRWGWGGPGSHGHVPPWAEDMHRKMHERMDAAASAPAAPAPAAPVDAAPAPVTDTPVTPAPSDAPAASQPPADNTGDAPNGEQRSV
jgi:hypothetical protein